jgi:lipoprotein-anchoring transpeptidase ErfK/SrfK
VVNEGDGRRRRATVRRHRRPSSGAVGRLGVTAAVAALVTVTGIVAAVLVVRPADSSVVPSLPEAAAPASGTPATPGAGSADVVRAEPGTGISSALVGTAAAISAPAAAGTDEAPASVSLVLTAADRQACPAKAAACVDLTGHITWLQHDGKVTYGPVQMEPGNPLGKHQTPRGTFHVSWKAGPKFVSSEYHEAMPWATFFAAGGIAFHGGPLTTWSHGCVHLTDHNAHFFQQHLTAGSEVVVF